MLTIGRIGPGDGSEGQEIGPDQRASDDELLQEVQAGSRSAFAELYRRHHADARRYAQRLVRCRVTTESADDVVAEAVRRTLSALRSGRGPRTGYRRYLFTAIRTAAAFRHSPMCDDDVDLEALAGAAHANPDEGLDGQVAMAAFATLPERSRQVLWETSVRGLSPRQVAPLFGVTPNTASALAARSRRALRIAYVRQHLPRAADHVCNSAMDLVARSAVVAPTPAQRRQVEAHLAECVACRGATDTLNGECRGIGAHPLTEKAPPTASPNAVELELHQCDS